MDDIIDQKEEIPTDGEPKVVNIAHRLRRMAALQPHKRAVVYPAGWDENGRVAYTHLTFMQLDRESDCLAHGLENIGIRRGVRTILMVRPSLEFFVLTFAMFKVGAVPVIVDPGMGVRRMVQCLRESKADAFIGIPKAHLMRLVYPAFFKTVNTWVTVGRRWFWSGCTLKHLYRGAWETYPLAETRADETAAILFTTGSTGPAKGVVYTHGTFDAQVRHIQRHFDIGTDEVDLPTFPLFSLFDPALGMTAVIPDMDPTRPAEVDPEKILEAIYNQGVTNMFASPALLNRVGGYGKAEGIRLPTLRRVISAGAPVSPGNIEQFSTMLEDHAEIHTPYGATEAMPVMSVGSREILSETRKFSEQGYGMCVGHPVEGIAVRIIRITDDPIEEWSDALVVEKGEIGEITVKGDIVTRQYFERPHDDALSKIREGDDIWHRMGDLGWRDNKGRVWFCGRKSHRVVTESRSLFTIPCEAVFNQHPAVFRSALIGIGKPARQKPVMCIELKDGGKGVDQETVKQELLNLAAKNPMIEDIKTILFHEAFPVDIRHNAKIFREELRAWAAGK
ncbi:peptide synthase [Desulfonema ishimotonii]|uniref:Peptide synthase n=1 Tax=Desulfonema ishimotonii TaxID=45657 RepID=A0A401FSS9_9BACT|nr:fatty acid CoA ligase family protein [Desulfonema ishimotonii]GBC60024.1 peptide synthase [Desulfonema ishimotonii]